MQTTKVQLQRMRDEAIAERDVLLVDQAVRLITVSIIQRAKAGESTYRWNAAGGSGFKLDMIESVVSQVRLTYPDIRITHNGGVFANCSGGGAFVIEVDWR